MDEVADRPASRPRDRGHLHSSRAAEDVDRLALPLFDVALLTIVKSLVDVPLPGATYDIVPPPPPLSTDPGVSLIAAGAAAKEY